MQFVNNQKLLKKFNETDVIVGKSLVKHIYNPQFYRSVLKNVEKFKKGSSEGIIIRAIEAFLWWWWWGGEEAGKKYREPWLADEKNI